MFFLKLASCIVVFEGAWHANSQKGERRMIALSNPTKQIEMMIGIDQLDPSCVSNHFESLSVHVTSYERKFPRACLWKANFADCGF